jgi:AIPR protein
VDSVTRALMNEFSVSNNTDDLEDDKKFEHFVAYSVLSSRFSDDFDTEDLVSGSGADLNIDAFAVIVNGRLAADAESVTDMLEMNGFLDVEFILIQAKTSSNFDGAAIIALGDNVKNELFADQQQVPVNSEIKRLIEIKNRIYENAAKLRGNPVCRIYYVTTGTWTGDQYLVTMRDRKISDLLNTNLFSEVHYELIGAKSVQDFYRDSKKSISREIIFDKLVTLPVIENVDASYLGVLNAIEFIKLISDQDGNIIKSVFIDNVRDFQGENPVNTDIAQTIKDRLFDQFVLRNNGITIVAKDIKVTSNKYTLIDYQIVNGCQTSHVIFSQKDILSDELLIPLKLIHTSSEEVSQNIIKSTNKQTPVDENDLLALTRFQRDLEDYYAAMPDDIRLYYERRARQYASRSDIEKGRIISIGLQLKCFASMFLDSGHQAGRYQGTLLKSVKDSVFQTGHRPNPYYTAALTFYRFEVAMRRLTGEDRRVRSFRFLLLSAFRYRYESSEFMGADSRKVADYCDPLNLQLQDAETSKMVFDECREIVNEAVVSSGLSFDRDSAKVRALMDEVKRIAKGRNLVINPIP